MKKLLLMTALALPIMAGSCEDDAQVANRNLTKAADNFEIMRRVVFYNGITGAYMMTIEGKCSIEPGRTLWVTCKTGPSEFKRHHLGLSDNVTYFVEQMEAVPASVYHTRITWKPQAILPEIDFRGSAEELVTDRVNHD